MKAILEFDLDNPEDHLDYKMATQALPMGLALWEITHNLRRRVEMQLEASTGNHDAETVISIFFDKLFEIIDNQGVDVVQAFNEINNNRRQPEDGRLFRSLNDVEAVVCKLFNRTPDELRKRNRQPGYVIPRQMAMALSVLHFPQITYADIGWHFGRFDHSTVSHALRAMKNKIDTEKDFREKTAPYFEGMRWPF